MFKRSASVRFNEVAGGREDERADGNAEVPAKLILSRTTLVVPKRKSRVPGVTKREAHVQFIPLIHYRF